MIPSPLAGFGTGLEKIQKQPEEIQRLVRATLRGIHLAKAISRKPSGLDYEMGAEMDQALADGSYAMAASSWSSNGVVSAQGIQIALEEIRSELKLEAVPRACDFRFMQQ